MIKSVVAAAAVASASAGSLRQLQASPSPLPDAPSTVTTVWAAHNTTAGDLDTLLASSAGHFRHAVGTLAGVPTADVTLVTAASVACRAGSDVFPCPASGPTPAYVVATIADGTYAPGTAHRLELAAGNAGAVESAFSMFDPSGFTHFELHHVTAQPNAWTQDSKKHDLDFGAYFGVGLGLCFLLLCWVFKGHAVKAVKRALAPAPAAPAKAAEVAAAAAPTA